MRKFTLLTVLAVTAVALVAIAEVPEEMTIDGCKDQKAAVAFPHKAHFEIAACVDCHHTSEGLTAETVGDMEVQKCGACHIEPEEADTPACSEKSLKKNPYHISCVGCHKDAKKEAKAEGAEFNGPTSCKGCHPKES